MTDTTVRESSAPNFCPPVEEGMIYTLADESNESFEVEFLGLIVDGDTRFAFFVEADPAEAGTEDDPLSMIVMEVTELDDDGQPVSFEGIADDSTAEYAFGLFYEATKDLYTYAD